jgi:taurine--2-oxoglutarate transaminase
MAMSIEGLTASMSTDEILQACRDYTLYDWSAQASVKPLAISHAKGVYLWDTDGKRYLDFNSQLMNVNIGHCDDRVIRAVSEQVAKLPYVLPGHATEPRAELGKLLNELTPASLSKAFFTNGGTEAVEAAIRIARTYTGRHKIIARYRSYHGATFGAMSLTGEPRRWSSEPGMQGVVRVLDPYEYRCNFCKGACNMNCLNHVEEVIQFEGPQNVAAIIMESVTGTNGIIIPPDGYWQGLRELCDKYGILLIADEVMAGFGRTGKWFAIEHWGVQPDMMTMAKGITSGYVPLGALMVSPAIAERFENSPLPFGLTYNSHTLALATAIATIKVYKEDNLIENAATVGKFLKAELEKLRDKHPSVGEVRAIGLFSVMELVKDRKTREPLVPFNPKPAEMGVMNQIGGFLRQNGVLALVRWNSIFCNPPLCITEEQLQEGLVLLDQALDIADKSLES